MHRRLTRIGLLLLSFGFIATTPSGTMAATALGTSTWSLEIASDLGTGGNDMSFAVRRHSGATSAFRFGLQVNAVNFDGNGTLTETGNPDEDVELMTASETYALSIQWMRFAAIRDNVAGTFALGPVLRRERDHFRQDIGQGLPSFDGGEFVNSRTTYGLELGLGVEWFLASRISLGAQTGIRAATGSSTTVQISRDGTGATYQKTESNVESEEIDITTSTARFQMTMYF